MHEIHPDFCINNHRFQSSEDIFQFLRKIESSDKNHIITFIENWLDENRYIKVKTSGSTGIPKEIHLDKQNIWNSALATLSFFKLGNHTKALLGMSAEYIAGKMMLVRAMIGGWNLHISEPSKNPLKGEEEYDFTAMVPYQIFHSIKDLHKVRKIIIGGGVVSPQLNRELEEIESEIFATYGMTETISHIAVRRLNGNDRSEVYHALPNVSFEKNASNQLIINAPKISISKVVTNDVVELLSDTEFRFLGRLDNVINSGGVKIHPEEVEQKLSTFISEPFFIASRKDDALGEEVVMIIEKDEEQHLADFQSAFQFLKHYERPRAIYTTPAFVYTDTDKIRRQEVLKKLGLI